MLVESEVVVDAEAGAFEVEVRTIDRRARAPLVAPLVTVFAEAEAPDQILALERDLGGHHELDAAAGDPAPRQCGVSRGRAVVELAVAGGRFDLPQCEATRTVDEDAVERDADATARRAEPIKRSLSVLMVGRSRVRVVAADLTAVVHAVPGRTLAEVDFEAGNEPAELPLSANCPTECPAAQVRRIRIMERVPVVVRVVVVLFAAHLAADDADIEAGPVDVLDVSDLRCRITHFVGREVGSRSGRNQTYKSERRERKTLHFKAPSCTTA